MFIGLLFAEPPVLWFESKVRVSLTGRRDSGAEVVMMNCGFDVFGWGGHRFGGVLVLLFWILVIGVVVALARGVFSRGGGGSPTVPESPLEILMRRYAKGEIDKAEFEVKKKDILGS